MRSAPRSGIAGQQAEVLVQTRGLGVVVAGTDMGVPADPVVLPAHHQTRLGVGLQAHHAVDDVHARRFQRSREVDVGLLVESRLELDEGHHLLAGVGRSHQRSDDGAIGGRAVQRLLDRQDGRVPCCLVDEGFHRGRERIVGVVHQDVAAPDRVEDIGRAFVAHEGRRHDGCPGLILQGGPVQADEEPQVAERQQPLGDVDLRFLDLELAHEHLAGLHAHRVVDLQPDRSGTSLPPLQDRFDRGQQIVGLVLFDLDIGVARDPEEVVRQQVHAGEQLIQVGRDDFLERHEPLSVGQLDEAWDVGWHLDARELPHPGHGVTHHGGDVQRQTRDVGERVRRVDRQRREDREDPFAEPSSQERPVALREVDPMREADAFLLQGRQEFVGEEFPCASLHLVDPLADRFQLLVGSHPVGRGDGHPCLDLLLQTRHPHLEELIQVLAVDREELDPFQQRPGVVVCERQHPRIELEPAQLTVVESHAGCGSGLGEGLHSHRRTAMVGGTARDRNATWSGVA